jgi:hypothetical protein
MFFPWLGFGGYRLQLRWLCTWHLEGTSLQCGEGGLPPLWRNVQIVMIAQIGRSVPYLGSHQLRVVEVTDAGTTLSPHGWKVGCVAYLATDDVSRSL